MEDVSDVRGEKLRRFCCVKFPGSAPRIRLMARIGDLGDREWFSDDRGEAEF